MDPIDRQLAINTLERKKDKNAKGDLGWFHNKIIQNDIDALMQLPSAQPEIIRCKNCRWFAGEGMYCTNNVLVPFDHFFCYYGERKEDEK
jgi:hypothetical protein